MSDAVPTLEVGFAFELTDAFGDLQQLQIAFDSAEGRLIRQALNIEKATGGMVKLSGAKAEIGSFGQIATQSMTRIEKAGEAMVRQLERQNLAFGRTREELRGLRAEERALSAERVGNTDLARRIREQAAELYDRETAAARQSAVARATAAAEAAAAEIRAQQSVIAQLRERAQIEAALARIDGSDRPRASAPGQGATFSALAALATEKDARAQAASAAAAKRAADEHARLRDIVRGSQAAQLADAEAAERLRMATDPLYAATKRLNEEIAESTRLYHAGVTGQAEYARQQQVLVGRLNGLAQAHDDASKRTGRMSGTLTQLSFQLNDVATMAAMGAPPLQIFASQAGQIFQVAQQAEGGVKGFAGQMGMLALRAGPAAIAVAVVGTMFYALNQQMERDSGLKSYAAGLGLTTDEMKKLKDVGVTTGDMFRGLATTLGISFDGAGNTIRGWITNIGEFFGTVVKGIAAATYGLFVGSYRAIIETWRQFPAAMGDLFVQAVNTAVTWIEALTNKAIDAVNWMSAQANKILPDALQIPEISRTSIDRFENSFAGAAIKVGQVWVKELNGATQEALDGIDGFIARWTANSQKAARDRLAKQAAAIIDDRTDKKPKVDRHAERLARDAEAVEAQIRNLYMLADAYGVSGGAALVAEARVKAESAAIRQRADIEAAVARQIRLAVAQRVADAAKTTAGMRDQAAVQEEVNAAVAAGAVPAERAAELLRDRMADLPLLAALEAARWAKDVEGAQKAADALDAQRAARDRLTDAEAKARLNASMSAGADRLEELRLEARLIGETDIVRARALATLRAEQEARRIGWGGTDAADYVKQQADIAEQTERNARAQREWNDGLNYMADRWDLIARNIANAGRGLGDAFGEAGRAIGDVAAIYADFRASDERARAVRDEAIRRGANVEREQARYSLAMSTAQVGMYGDMAAAAKGFFDEKSKGYKAMQTAEKAFRAVEFALSARAIAQDVIETGSKLASSAARTAASAVEAVAKAIASLPFPANIAAGAATAAALASVGIAMGGMFGGGGDKFAPANEGTGTVLGDPKAQSESIRRAIDQLRDIDTVMLGHSREMAASLRSIDSQIGGLAAVIVRGGDINASAGVVEGFKPNLIGSVLGAIPLVGGFLGSLFGSKTSVVASGLYGGPQSLGSILSGGFDASTYSDIEKTKKFLGITTGKSRSTQYGAADPGLENQFTLILRSFNDAIAAAAGPLGAATSDIQQRLNGFVVNIGKIDLKGLTGEQIGERLSAIFGAAADSMAAAAFPGIERFRQVGEGTFETLVRVASTVETVNAAMMRLGGAARTLGIDAAVGLAAQFESLGEMSGAVDAYFERFYSKEEQTAARAAQLAGVFLSLGTAMPDSLSGFRALVEAQDLTTAAGQKTYAALLQLAPAFADLQAAMAGAKSAADILAERQDLERRLLELAGDTAALRALDLAKIDPSNRALQEQVWAIEDAKEAARAAEELRDAWSSVGDTIMDEVRRIRGLANGDTGAGFAALQGQFNAASAAARGGDIEAARSLPGLSQALLSAAEAAATSRQELQRIQALTAASLEATYAAIGGTPPVTNAALLTAAATTQTANAPAPANDDMASEIRALRSEVAQMRQDANARLEAVAGNTASMKRKLDDVTAASGGDAISVVNAA